MATVVSPGSTPVPVYNQEGRTVDTITAGGTDASTATAIPQFAQETILLVNGSTTSGSGLVLPVGANAGDVVELLGIAQSPSISFLIYTAGSDTLNGVINNTDSVTLHGVFRKVSATGWLRVS
jgi:hypothetical protein